MDAAARAKLETRVARLEQQIRAFKDLHASELGLILDELASLRADVAAMASEPALPAAPTADPSASPKRARWLAEEERKAEARKAPLSRRELLTGREREGEEA